MLGSNKPTGISDDLEKMSRTDLRTAYHGSRKAISIQEQRIKKAEDDRDIALAKLRQVEETGGARVFVGEGILLPSEAQDMLLNQQKQIAEMANKIKKLERWLMESRNRERALEIERDAVKATVNIH